MQLDPNHTITLTVICRLHGITCAPPENPECSICALEAAVQRLTTRVDCLATLFDEMMPTKDSGRA